MVTGIVALVGVCTVGEMRLRGLAESLQEVKASILRHEAVESHRGTGSELAEIHQKFSEVETQFKWKEEAASQRIAQNRTDILALEEDAQERSERWVPLLVSLDERLKVLERSRTP